MVKSKNHTNHNQNAKNHRNGIKAIPKNKYGAQTGVNQTLKKNTRRGRKFDPTVVKEVNLEKKIERMRKNKQLILAAIKARIEAKAAAKEALKNKSTKKKKKKKKKKTKKSK